jgi:hypothetical protein
MLGEKSPRLYSRPASRAGPASLRLGAHRRSAGGLRRMRFILYTHSLVSDWNHGIAHFLRGVPPMLIPTRKRMARSGGWSPSRTGTFSCTFTAQRTAPSMLSNISSSLNDLAVVFFDGWVDQVASQNVQAVQRPSVV